MARFGTVWPGHKMIRRHLILPEFLFEKMQEEAINEYGGNISLWLQQVLLKRYKIKASTIINS